MVLGSRRSFRLVVTVLACALALGVVACGDDDDEKSSGASPAQGRAVEKAFLTGMTHHHETAIEMARIAQRRGTDPFITSLAKDIVTTQEREMGQMKQIYARLFSGTLKPDPGAHDGLGLSAEEAGMTHTEATNRMLEAANPFDRAFVDEMVPHHTGAIRMAKVVLAGTSDPALKRLATGIITTQQREVAEMNRFRTRKFGGPVPAAGAHGGQPQGGATGPQEDPADGGHGGGHG